MNRISELKCSGCKRAMIYKYKGDDGLLVEFNHGRMYWFRVDNRHYIDVDNYEYWESAQEQPK